MTTLRARIELEADPDDHKSLPGWLYHDPEFFTAERTRFLRAAPQVVCHVNEIAQPGDWRSRWV